jgi:hypothetical protein
MGRQNPVEPMRLPAFLYNNIFREYGEKYERLNHRATEMLRLFVCLCIFFSILDSRRFTAHIGEWLISGN